MALRLGRFPGQVVDSSKTEFWCSLSHTRHLCIDREVLILKLRFYQR